MTESGHQLTVTPDKEWDGINELAATMRTSGAYPTYADEVRSTIRKSLAHLVSDQDWYGIIRLRSLFGFLEGGETLGLGSVLSQLNRQAITAALALGDNLSAGQFLHDEGQALHRQGKHVAAIGSFEESCKHFRLASDELRARESYYMTALCHRALGSRTKAREIIEQVLKETGDHIWRANPLVVLSWLQQDEGDLKQAEATIRESVSLFEGFKGSNDVQVGQSLADLAEIVGFQGRYSEAEEVFERALSIFSAQPTAHPRQIARTLLKRAEVYTRHGKLDEAMKLLRQAYLTIAEAQYYDLMWRIQLAMAQINLRQEDYAELTRHIRLALKHRRAIGLADWALVKQYLARRKMGTGLPR